MNGEPTTPTLRPGDTLGSYTAPYTSPRWSIVVHQEIDAAELLDELEAYVVQAREAMSEP